MRLVVDEGARAGGRGAYLCAEQECWSQAVEGSAIARALRGSLTPDEREALRVFAADRFTEGQAA